MLSLAEKDVGDANEAITAIQYSKSTRSAQFDVSVACPRSRGTERRRVGQTVNRENMDHANKEY